MEKKIALFVLGIILISSILFISNKDNEKSKDRALEEISRLLLPVYNKQVTSEDFNYLYTLVKKDKKAKEEVEEIRYLAGYKEYPHISHSLTSLYQYIQTGKENICPGHHLAHYFVFLTHNNSPLAQHNLEEARENIVSLENGSYNLSQESLSFIKDTLKNIDSGISNVSIEQLTDISCVSK